MKLILYGIAISLFGIELTLISPSSAIGIFVSFAGLVVSSIGLDNNRKS
ncbi:MAG: hypothetical protein RSA01_08755 [Clostridium sp.]